MPFLCHLFVSLASFALAFTLLFEALAVHIEDITMKLFYVILHVHQEINQFKN